MKSLVQPNGVEVTFSDSTRNCLVLFQPTSILDGVLRVVDFINTSESSTVVRKETFGDGYVVVYCWNSSQSIFEGEVSLIIQLDPPTSKCLCRLSELTSSIVFFIAAAPTTPPTSDLQTDPPPPDIESLPTSLIAGRFLML